MKFGRIVTIDLNIKYIYTVTSKYKNLYVLLPRNHGPGPRPTKIVQ